MSNDEIDWFASAFSTLTGNVEQAVLGKTNVVRLALTCLVAEGHLLLEDYPGTGKTSLAKAVAASVQGSQKRIQFTPDLMPSDITGVTIHNRSTGSWDFHPGPVFATIVLADEINRASPKTQAALLEVMEEGHVTVDGTPHPVGAPFMVVATQNPVEQAGTYRLPEAQLDRFLMRTGLGYPDHATTVRLLSQASVRDRTTSVEPVITTKGVLEMSAISSRVHVDPALLEYVSQLAAATREATDVRLGVSVRGCLAHVRAAKVWAAAHGREYVTPDDLKALALPVLAHRLLLDPEAEFLGTTSDEVVRRVLADIAPPLARAGALT